MGHDKNAKLNLFLRFKKQAYSVLSVRILEAYLTLSLFHGFYMITASVMEELKLCQLSLKELFLLKSLQVSL